MSLKDKEIKTAPINVLNSKLGKTVVASTVLTGIGLVGAFDIFIPGEEKVEAATITPEYNKLLKSAGMMLISDMIVGQDGYIYANGMANGTTNEYFNVVGFTDAQIWKLDMMGNVIWVKNFGGIGGEFGQNIIQYDSSTIVSVMASDVNDQIPLSGDSEGNTTKSVGAFVAYDLNGNQKWIKQYNKGVTSSFISFQKSPTGGYYALGQYKLKNATNHSYELIKYDNNLNIQWTKPLADNGDITVTPDGGAVVFNGSGEYVNNIFTYRIQKYNASGVLQLNATGQQTGQPAEIAELNGEYIAINSIFNMYTGRYAYNLAKFNSSGNIVTTKSMDDLIGSGGSISEITKLANGTFTINGTSAQSALGGSPSKPVGFLLTYDSSFNEISRRVYDVPLGISTMKKVLQLGTNDYLATGYQYNAGIHLLRYKDIPPANATLSVSESKPTNKDVNVTISYPTDAYLKQYKIGSSGTWTNYTGPIALISNNTIFARSQDLSQNWSAESNLAISNIDKTAPANATLSLSSNAPTNGEVSVTISYPNDATVKEYKIGTSGTWKDYSVPVVVTANETIYARSKDAVGNISAETNLVVSNIDKTPPGTPTLSASNGSVTNGNVTVEITYPADAATKQYRVNGGTWAQYLTPVVVAENSLIEAQAIDAAGNISAIGSLDISNIDKDSPVITLTPTKTAPTNVAIDVDIDIVDNNPIIEKKWAAGTQDVTFFNTGGTDVIGDSFNVSDNGTYTVYAKDSAGNTTIKTITVSNIDMVAPTITLTPTKIDPTNVAIDVDVDVQDNNTIVEKKWAKGTQNASYFLTSGTDIVGDSFNVSENDVYTVFAKDSAGNVTLKSITVSNIDMDPPTITLTPSTIDATNAQIDVDVQVADKNTIVEMKWAEGNQPVSYFATDGTTLTGNSFIVSDNGMYTVYAKDSAGNESVQTLTVLNLDFDAPVITLTPETVDPINTAIHVDVDVMDGNPIVEKKWTRGKQDLTYFATNGTTLVGDQFLVSENDVYTVYAKDAAGNESLEFITVDNLDFDKPGTSSFVLSNTNPTNTNVDVTITYPNDAYVKEYKVGASGSWQTYSGPVAISQNDTVFARSKDAAGNYSDESTIAITNIDTTAPVVKISGIVNGDTYVNEATPTHDVQDLNNVTVEVLLNGSVFAGGTVKDSGSYVYTVTARDAAGNVTTETMAFHVNHTPEVVGPVANKTVGKFGKETIDLSTLFTDTENDKLTYTVTSSDPKIISAINTAGSLEIEALLQGKATITIIAHDKYSDSNAITFEVEVTSSAPVLTFTNEETKVIAKEDSVTIEGTVKDADKDDVTVTVTLNGVIKTAVIPTTGAEDNWSIEFEKGELPTGAYSISIKAEDPFGGSVDLTSAHHIVKLPGVTTDYEPILSGYEKDITKDRQDFTLAEHQVLLDAYIAVEGLKSTNNPDEWMLVKPKIDALADGTVKEGFYRSINGNALDYLNDNFDKATKSDYETAGMTDVQDTLVPKYNEKNTEYLAEKGDLSETDIQLIIDIVNAVDKATTSNKIVDWKAALDLINQLEDGAVKDVFLQDVENGLVKAIEVNPSELTKDVVESLLAIPVIENREVEYQSYLQDELVKDGALTKERLEDVITTVNGIEEALSSFKANPTQDNLTAFETLVNSLTDGVYKLSKEALYPTLNLDMVVHDPSNMTGIALDTIGVIHDVKHLELYKDFLTKYLNDVAKEKVTKDVLQTIIDVVIAVEEVKASPTDENIQKVNDLLKDLDPTAKIVEDTKQEVNGSIVDTINKDFTNVTEKQLENIGIDEVITSRLPNYQEALDEYAKEHDPTDLSVEDIQNVVDAINGVENAKETPSEEIINKGYDAVNQLDDGPLKDKLLQELEDITVDYISNNPGAITQELLDHANLDTDSSLLDSYKEYLEDVLPGMAKPVSKEQLQNLIDEVNNVWALYHEAIANPSKANVVAFESSVTDLEKGKFQDKMQALVDDVALVYLVASPSTQEADDYARLNISIDENNLSAYNTNMAKYIQDIGPTFTFNEINIVVSVTDKVEIAIADSTTANVQLGLQAVRSLETGQLRADLSAALNGEVMGDINLNPGTVTADDLINLGIEHVNPALEKEYQDALTKLKDDLGGTLTFEDVQNAIDAVNAVNEAIKTGKHEDIVDAYEKVNKLPNGSLKDDLLAKLKDITVKDIINNPNDTTTEMLDNAGFEDIDSELEDEYKDAFNGYEQPLTEESIQQLVDIVNQVKTMRLDLTQDARNTLSDMVTKLADSVTKDNLTLVYEALNQLYSTEHSFNQNNVRNSFDAVALVNTRERAYLDQMANSFAQVLTALVTPSDETVALAQGELIKLEDGQLKTRFQTRVGGAYLEHVITTPGSSSYTDWVNAGFENVEENDFPIYKGIVGSITDEVGQLTKEQIQAIIDAINAMEHAKKNPTNATIQVAKEKIQLVVDSTWKKGALVEMDALLQSIQPKPKPPVVEVTPTPPVVKPVAPIELPKPSDKVMVVQNEHAAIQLEIPTIEISESSELKVKIKIHAKDLLNGSKLYIYANSANARGLGAATNNIASPGVQLIGANGKVVEIDFGKMEKGTIEVDRDLVFGEDGEYLLKGVFVANGTNLETNTVKISVHKELLIPNTVLPNLHGLPVATLKVNQDISLKKLDKEGNFVSDGSLKKDSLHLVYDTHKGYYQLADGHYVKAGTVTVHIGKGEVRKDSVNVYDKNGRFLRTIKKGQQYKVYSYDEKRYSIGGGEFIEVQDGVTYVFGWMTIDKTMTLYKADGTAERTLNKGEKYRIYRADAEYLHLGGGFKVKRDLSKFTFLKN